MNDMPAGSYHLAPQTERNATDGRASDHTRYLAFVGHLQDASNRYRLLAIEA